MATIGRWNVSEAILPSSGKPGVEIITGSNFDYPVLHFDKDTEQKCFFSGQIPDNYGAAANTSIEIRWLTDATATGVVRWAAQILGRENGETWDVALSSEVAVDDARTAASSLHVATASFTAPALAPGDEFIIAILRKAAHANDTYTADGDLLGLRITA